MNYETAPLNVIVVGCGFLGKTAAQLFSSRGDYVLGIVSSNDSREKIITAQKKEGCFFDIAACDVMDEEAVDSLSHKIPRGATMIYALSSGKGGAEKYTAIYRDGMQRLLKAWQPRRIIFVSSTSVYAQASGEKVTELSRAEPERETSRILLEAEKIALGVSGIAARFSGIYGPGRSVLLKKFLSGEAILENKGERFINQIHRDDGARALLHLALSENATGIYNVTDDTPVTQHDVYQWIADYFGKPMPLSGPADLHRKRAWTSKKISNEKLRALGWKPDFPSYREALYSGKLESR
ncbi:MAG: NAD-dependent epimerase/dehydratase family protein [Chthoniobacterales bacterium]